MVVWLTVPASWIGRAALHLIHAVQAAQSRRRARFESRTVRGITLLGEWLSPQQRQQLECFNHFEVIGCDSGKSYRISTVFAKTSLSSIAMAVHEWDGALYRRATSYPAM